VYDKKKSKRYYLKNYSMDKEMGCGEIGCALSHRAVYNKIKREKIRRAVILEDDAELDEGFTTVIKLLENLPIARYVVKLDALKIKQTKNINGDGHVIVPWHKIQLSDDFFIQYSYDDCWTTAGYYIDIKAAKTMSRLTKKIFLVADNWSYFQNYIKLRILNKVVVWQNRIFESTIKMEPLKYVRTAERPNNLFIKVIKKIKRKLTLYIKYRKSLRW
jgi:glycosyl transferase family 25